VSNKNTKDPENNSLSFFLGCHPHVHIVRSLNLHIEIENNKTKRREKFPIKDDIEAHTSV
jgi:hypothetical protein